MKALRRFTVRAHLPERLSALERLSINLRWSWDKPTQDLFEAIDPALWKQVGCDPVAMLGQVSPASGSRNWPHDESFVQRLDDLAADLDNYLTRPLWYQELAAEAARRTTGCCRTASRTSRWSSASPRCCRTTPAAWASWRVITSSRPRTWVSPLIAVGLYYRSGYFRQSLTADGWQHESYPSLDPQGLPLRLLTDAGGEAILVELAMPGRGAAVRAGLDRAGRPNSVAAAGFRHPGERARSARGHRPPLRR